MAGNVDKVQLQVEVVRNQLDTLIKDVNALKSEKLTLTVDSSGMDAINKFNRSMQTLTQNAKSMRGAFTKIWAGEAEDAPTRTIEKINEGLGRTTEIIRTLDKETGDYTVAQTKQTANYDQMAKAAQRAAEADAKAAQQARAYLLAEQEAAQKAAARYDPTPMQQQIEALTGVSNASKSAAESASVFQKAWLDSSDKVTAANQRAAEQAQQVFSAAQERMPTLQKQYADLARSIEGATKKYKDGTFDSLKSKAAGARASLDALDADLASGKIGYDEYVKGVENARSGLKDLQNEFSQTRAQTDNLQKTTNILGDSLGNIVKKIIAWQVINASVAAVIRSFKEAVATLKDVDTELVAIQKVTNNTDAEMAKLSQHAYEVASQYGVAVTDYLQSTGAFAKAGYKELSEDMAELATKTQLVGDVNAETANQFLLSADAAYKLHGNVTALSEVLDKANVIENNYATSIQKIAEGLPNVASIASMTNVSIDELMAALGTITSVTQESGSRASYALRALLLNIMGDTKTEIEDGVSWTKEEIESLSDVLWKYSRDAMEAAQATGSIVNPMEAIAGLAQAYKEGVLTEAELAKIESELGGKLRTNQLDALIKNYDMYSEMLDKVADSAGSADEEVSIMLSSWESKANILKNTWTEFISKTVDTGWIKGLLDALTWLIDGFDNLGNAILVAAGILTAIKLPSIISAFTKFGTSIANLLKYFPLLISNTAAYNAVTGSTVTTVTAAQIAIGALTAAVAIGIIAFNKIKGAQEEARQAAIDAGKAAAQEAGELKDLYQNYTDLRSAYQDGTATKQEFDGATERLLEKLGYEKDEIGELTEEYGKYHDAIRKATAAELEANLYDARSATIAAQKELLKKAGSIYGDTEAGNPFDDPEQVRKQLEFEIQKRNEAIDSGKTDSWAYSAREKRIKDLTDVLAVYDEALEDQLWLEGALKAAREGTLDSYDRETEAAAEGTQRARENTEAISAQLEALQEYSKQLDAQKNDLSAAAQALAEYQRNGRVSAQTYQSLTGLSAKYVQMLTNESGALEITEDRLRDVVAAIQDDAKQTEALIGITAKSSGVMDGFVAALKAAAKQAGATDDAVNDLVAQMIVFSNTGLSVGDKIAALQSLALQAGVTQSAIAGISMNGIAKDAEMTVEEAQKKYGMSLTEASRYIRDQKEKAQNTDQALIDYWNTLADNIPEIKSTAGGSGGGGGASASDANLTARQKKVSLLKSELTLMQNQGRSADLQKEKMRQIQQALHAQAQYLRAIGGSQEDINALSAEWWEWQKKIKGEVASTQDLLSELQSALQDRLQDAADQRDAELAAIDEQIAALKRQKDEKDDQLKLEEKILAVQKARADLANAQAERTIRQYNAKTGQWEWVADQKDVDDAKKALEKAEKDLTDFKEELEYNARLAELEAQKDAINAWYDRLEAQYKRLTDSLKEKTRGIGEILQDIWKNATPELKAVILENAEIFKAFGIDVKALSDAVNEAAREIYGLTANGDRYDIKSEKGQDFIKNAKPGDKMTGSDGSTWVKNRDGSVTITDKWGRVFTVDGSTGGSGGGADTGYGGDEGDEEDFGGGKYSGTVYAVSDDGKKYKISSAKGLNFLNTAKAGARMEAGDGSVWVKKANGRTVITDKYGRIFTVYDQGGLLRGMGGIKATAHDELVLPPDLTQLAKQRFASVKNIAPSQDAQSMRLLDGMRQMLGAEGGRGGVTNASYDNRSVGTQYNGDIYNLNGMTFTEQQVGGMTMREFVRSARTLAICKNGN